MDNKVFLTSEGARQFTNALELLNTSIKEFNQIADKMIPENLIKFGLCGYLHEFCSNLEAESKLKMTFSCNEENINVTEEMEISLFRCVRNIIIILIRHSHPSEIGIKLNKSDRFLSLIINDDGNRNILIDTDLPVKQELENMKAIISLYNGVIRTNTLQTGNEIEIQVPV